MGIDVLPDPHRGRDREDVTPAGAKGEANPQELMRNYLATRQPTRLDAGVAALAMSALDTRQAIERVSRRHFTSSPGMPLDAVVTSGPHMAQRTMEDVLDAAERVPIGDLIDADDAARETTDARVPYDPDRVFVTAHMVAVSPVLAEMLGSLSPAESEQFMAFYALGILVARLVDSLRPKV